MSERYPGGIISKTAPTPTGPFQNGTAPGVWTLEQQAYWQKQGLWPIAGNVDPSAFIENLFQTWLYTGNGSTQTITNGIDLAGKGGLVWTKNRTSTTGNGPWINDTERGITKYISTSATDGQIDNSGSISSVSSSGYTLGSFSGWNASSNNYVGWTFRKQPKFFDVVTYTGNGSNRTIAHNLGSVPGMIIVKRTDTTGSWFVYHRGTNGGTNPQNFYTLLNDTLDQTASSGAWNNTAPTSTVFSVGTTGSVNANGGTFVAYLFAHDAGGFGLSGNENVISCGSFTTDGSGNVGTVTLGYEPQYILFKRTDNVSGWTIFDTMRGWNLSGTANGLQANNSDQELNYAGGVNYVVPTATGFSGTGNFFGINATIIYMAIRRGPMATPTVGTSVFSPLAVNNLQNTVNTTGFPIDLQWYGNRSGGTSVVTVVDRLRGVSTNTTQQANFLVTSNTNAEVTTPGNLTSNFWTNTTFRTTSLADGANAIWYSFRRAPGFMDVVCYTGTGSPTNINHNLGVAPELMVVKCRSNAANWPVYPNDPTKYLFLNDTSAPVTSSAAWNNTPPNASTFRVGTFSNTNEAGFTYVAYLFASVAGVSKVGSYTGTGTTQVINCGFTTGARFILIRRTDSTGDWYVWNSARGIVAGNDPYLLLNSTAAEVTNTDFIDPASSGFEISSTAPAAINANGGTFIFLAIA